MDNITHINNPSSADVMKPHSVQVSSSEERSGGGGTNP